MDKPAKTQELHIRIDATELNAQQKRLIRSVSTLLAHALTTDDEAEYFDSSSELLKLVAGAIKQANFSTIWRENTEIPYATQALEFSLDNLSEHLQSEDLIRYDN